MKYTYDLSRRQARKANPGNTEEPAKEPVTTKARMVSEKSYTSGSTGQGDDPHIYLEMLKSPRKAKLINMKIAGTGLSPLCKEGAHGNNTGEEKRRRAAHSAMPLDGNRDVGGPRLPSLDALFKNFNLPPPPPSQGGKTKVDYLSVVCTRTTSDCEAEAAGDETVVKRA